MNPAFQQLHSSSVGSTDELARASADREALREAQRLAHIGSWSWDARTDSVVGSDELFRIYGLDPLAGRFPDFKHQNGTLYPPESWQRIDLAARGALETGKGYELDVIALRRGTPVWVTARGEAVRDANGRVIGLRGTVQDIDERKRAEEQLRRSQETFLQLIEDAPFGVYVIDAQFRLAQVSAGSQKVFSGVRPLLGRDFAEVLRVIWPDPFASEAIARFRHTLATGEPYAAPNTTEKRADVAVVESYDWKIQRITMPDGQFGVVCYFFDITERQQSEAALRRSQEQLALVSNTVPALISYVDTECRYQLCNRAYTDWFGFTTTEILGRTMREVLGEKAWRAIEPHILKALSGQTAEFETEAQYIRGGTRWIHAVYTPHKDAQGKVLGLVVMVFDSTAQKRAEEALRASVDATAAASRAKDDFLAALSHELRTPLAPVMITAGALEADEKLDAEMRQQMGMIRQNIELEARLIDDLLDLTKIARGKLLLRPVPTDLHQVLQHTRTIIEHEAAEKNVAMEFALRASRHQLNADPARLQQVFWNLLKNAVKFSKPGGRITVTTENPAPRRIAVHIKDEGIGITPDALARIFQPFDQGDLRGRHAYGGLGLGLSISKSIIDLHGGVLRADSAGSDRGSVFTLELELNESSAPLALRPARSMRPATPLRLLVVEDHAPSLNAVARLLERDGHTVHKAMTVQEAIAIAAKQPCDAVISDLGLPDGNGYDLMIEITRRYSWPGIAMSGFGMDDDVKRSKNAGFVAHLIKPVSLEKLRDEITRLRVAK
jgi:PAS domain S-box-containing protein